MALRMSTGHRDAGDREVHIEQEANVLTFKYACAPANLKALAVLLQAKRLLAVAALKVATRSAGT